MGIDRQPSANSLEAFLNGGQLCLQHAQRQKVNQQSWTDLHYVPGRTHSSAQSAVRCKSIPRSGAPGRAVYEGPVVIDSRGRGTRLLEGLLVSAMHFQTVRHSYSVITDSHCLDFTQCKAKLQCCTVWLEQRNSTSRCPHQRQRLGCAGQWARCGSSRRTAPHPEPSA